MNTVDCEQGTELWLAARVGRITGSRVSDVLAKLKSGCEAATRRNYKAQLVAERVTGKPMENGYESEDMKRGKLLEPIARAAYEISRDVMVEQIGLCIHPELEFAAASPDGLIGEDGVLEIKVPKISTHIDYLLAGVVPTDYQPQILWEMACTGRQWCDFVSYCPDLPSPLDLFVVRFERDETRIEEITQEVIKFNAEVDQTISRLRALGEK